MSWKSWVGLCVGSLGAVLALGCSAGGSSRSLVVGTEGTGGGGSVPPGAGGALFAGGDAGPSKILSAHIEQDGVTVTFVTLSCSNQCADVEAVAHGGFEPYAFAWEDGSTSPARRVCPASTTDSRVEVTDSGSRAGEFRRDPMTVTAPLTANVIRCPDGGAPGGDGGSPPGGDLCLTNPSLEGTPAWDVGNNFAAPWATCSLLGADVWGPSMTDVGQQGPSLSPTDGSTYARMGASPTGTLQESISEALCAPMHVATSYGLKLDLASPFEVSGETAGQIEIWGAASSCGEGELLWTSPVLGQTFSDYCVTLTPTAETAYLTIVPRAPSGPGQAVVYLDHLVPVSRCP